MIDKFDYLEPACSLCGGREFYYPEKDGPLGRIPVDRILSKVDSLFGRNDPVQAGKLLNYWKEEAVALRDKAGELSIQSELVGFYRKQNDAQKGLAAIARALELVRELEQGELASGATVLLNCATACQAFGQPERAMILYQQVEQVYGRTLAASDSRFGGLYNNMALTLADLGQYERAEQAYRRALAIMEQVPRGEAEAAITWINLAYLYEQQDDGERIRECMRRAYSLLQSRKLPHDGYYAFVLEKCAPAFAWFGDAEACAKLQREAEEIYARA